jgi:hypothetical protein
LQVFWDGKISKKNTNNAGSVKRIIYEFEKEKLFTGA